MKIEAKPKLSRNLC